MVAFKKPTIGIRKADMVKEQIFENWILSVVIQKQFSIAKKFEVIQQQNHLGRSLLPPNGQTQISLFFLFFVFSGMGFCFGFPGPYSQPKSKYQISHIFLAPLCFQFSTRTPIITLLPIIEHCIGTMSGITQAAGWISKRFSSSPLTPKAISAAENKER